ncbi:hypothetical protein DUI87_21234 [Hirundo rustica rustica]|uniref:Immunoglobulin V-set domain-containing protein n=1 Tax=Hirundo rustica rustica TaxID=333673 RepID=A0A3M0JM08_HIRRU|nr:hypothetical protein DUI87_21234 [Hirundo rustica rustica]
MAPGASKKTWGSVEVALADLCAILLCCGPMLTCCRRAEPKKTAEISRYKPMTETEKYRLINHTPVFEIEILNLHQNDSGSYYCGLITFFEPDKVMESSRSQLIVTAAPQMNATDEPEMEEGSPSEHVKAMLLGILLLAGVVVLLIFGCLTLMYRRGDVQKPHSENMPADASELILSLAVEGACAGDGSCLQMLNHHHGVTLQKEEKPPVVSVSTVDYGVLEFQRDQHTPVPLKTWPVEQTEYATIIFPEEKPVTPERGKKHLDERTREPC